jgi:glucokinase
VTSATSGCSVGIDVGGTKTAVVVVERGSGTVLAQRRIETTAPAGARQLHDRLGPVITELREVADVEVDGVGVGVPELVTADGVIVTDVVVPGIRGDLVSLWADLGVTAVEADVRAAAAAEWRLGAASQYASFGYVSVGTGISHCLVIDGVAWAGANGAAILLGSGVLVDRFSLDGSSGRPPLEEFASGPGIVAAYQSAGGVAESAQQVLQRCEVDELARDIVERAGRALGLGLAELVNLLDPEAIVVGGGLGSAQGHYWDAMVSAARDAIWADAAREVPIAASILGPLAGAVGAALIGRPTHEEPRHD